MGVTINGRSYEGSSVIFSGDQVIIDGERQEGRLQGVVEVRITEGEPVLVQSDTSVTCGNVQGDVNAGMGVNCRDVGGNVQAGMSVNCGNVGGSVKARMTVTETTRRR